MHAGGDASLSRKILLLGAAGEGALAGWFAGLLYGGWDVFLGRDWEHGFLRLAAEKLGSSSLAGGVIGALASLLLRLALDFARRRGPAALRMTTLALLAIAGAGGCLAVFPFRERLFPLHLYSTRLLSLTIVAGIALCGAALLARAILAPRGSGAARALAGAGFLLVFSSLAVQLAAPRLPLPAGASGRSILLISLDTLRGDRL